ncbi:hypothetical protein JRO89_XS10G0102300 [Xanthoceras sorbifolium]|uniref:Uncharacterized protein n=1 Tax=Xanthoceras sorbifolium TaxID=99658 RepID=A0ABQ8HI93_9ROSI|nr:hypothetical protein JRO89_XS10G0102300 [Xanthoceras sorbifolium]
MLRSKTNRWGHADTTEYALERPKWSYWILGNHHKYGRPMPIFERECRVVQRSLEEVSQRAGGSDDAESKQRRQSYVRRMKSCNKTGGYLQWDHCTGGSGANRDGQLEESATCGTLDYTSD